MATIKIGYYERVKDKKVLSIKKDTVNFNIKNDDVIDAGSLTVEAEIEIEKGH